MTLESRAKAQFDGLVSMGELLWAETAPQYVSSAPFNFQLRVAESLKKKPMSASQKKVDNAFSDDNPDFSLGQIGPKHNLILNKFSVVRPQFVLPTIDFESQNEPLSLADFQAVWEVLSSLENEYIAIFNCGVEAGASVGHKHLQIIPCPDSKEHKLFPDEKLSEEGIVDVPKVPFQHAIQKLPESVASGALAEIYQRLRDFLSLYQRAPHNMILTHRWMMVVPRTKARMGKISANAAAMIGIVWMASNEELKVWTEQDPMLHLQCFGVARSGLEDHRSYPLGK